MSSWERRKERIANDPEFAERIRRQQRESAARRRARAKEAGESSRTVITDPTTVALAESMRADPPPVDAPSIRTSKGTLACPECGNDILHAAGCSRG